MYSYINTKKLNMSKAKSNAKVKKVVSVIARIRAMTAIVLKQMCAYEHCVCNARPHRDKI